MRRCNYFSFTDQTLQYPFFFRPQVTNNKVQIEDGWTAFAPVSEWSRLLATHGDEWRISYLNRDYKVCNSYPSAVIVPRQIEDKVIIASSTFRDGGRFPVLCYRHEGGVGIVSCIERVLVNFINKFTQYINSISEINCRVYC